MTPERLAKIRAAFGLPGATWPTLELGRELLAHVDQLTAENSELQGAVDLCNQANKVYADDWNKAQEQVASLRQGVERLTASAREALKWFEYCTLEEAHAGPVMTGDACELGSVDASEVEPDDADNCTCQVKIIRDLRDSLRETEGLVKP